MRYPVMIIYDKNNIEITATIENDSEEYLSCEKVTGIVLYIEQFRDEIETFAAMSILIAPDSETALLKNHGFPEETAGKFLKMTNLLRDEISGYVRKAESDYERIKAV